VHSEYHSRLNARDDHRAALLQRNKSGQPKTLRVELSKDRTAIQTNTGVTLKVDLGEGDSISLMHHAITLAMRSAKHETLVDTSPGDSRPGSDQRKWCAGIAVDTDGGKFYWTPKGGNDAGLGRIFRTNIQVPQGQSPENRRDIELLYDNHPEPIDLDLDPVNRTLYWTDRGDPPRGNTVNRAPMDPEAENGKEPEILFTHLMEGIGLALDLKGGRMFITDFGGSVYSANLDGSNRRTLLVAEGNLTGIAYAEVPSGY
jgi:hypothetical protein